MECELGCAAFFYRCELELNPVGLEELGARPSGLGLRQDFGPKLAVLLDLELVRCGLPFCAVGLPWHPSQGHCASRVRDLVATDHKTLRF